MVMSWILCAMLVASFGGAVLDGNGAQLTASVLEGAQAGITLSLSIAGSLCLWSGVGKLLEHSGMTAMLAKLLSPALHWLFPSSKLDSILAGTLSGNICANIFGLGNAATPMGIQSVKRMQLSSPPGVASDEMCRLIVLNTASIQLIPSNVAAVRAAMGCRTPFDILPAVWITSLCSAGLGITVAFFFGKVFHHA